MSDVQETQGLVEEPDAAIFAATDGEASENDGAVEAEAGEAPEQG